MSGEWNSGSERVYVAIGSGANARAAETPACRLFMPDARQDRRNYSRFHKPAPASYEAFLLAAQPPCVDCTLPQDSADVSNTDSNRKEGAVYGFFSGEGVELRVLSLFD